MRTTTRQLAVLCGALLLALTACTANTGDKHGGKGVKYVQGGTYTSSISADPGNLNPLIAQTSTANYAVAFAYDTLINLDVEGNVVSGLAAKWTTTPTSATYTLRKDVTCSDGSKLDPRAVAATFEWIKDPKNASSQIGGKLPSTDFTVTSDNAAGTVTVTLPHPYGFLLVGAGAVPIVCPAGLADPKLMARTTYGTGPFTLKENVADDHLTFAVRKDYRWGPGGLGTNEPGTPAKVVLKVVKDSTTAVNLFLSGQLNNVAATALDQARLNGHGFETKAALAGPDDMFFNQRKDRPTADLAVRKALTLALDLPELVKVVSQNSGTRPESLSLLAPRPCRIDTVKGQLPTRDMTAARHTLDQAGWVAGASGTRAKAGRQLKVTLLYPSGDSGVAAGMELVSQWWKDLGAPVKLKGVAPSAFVAELFGGNTWDVSLLGVQLTYPNQFAPYASGAVPPGGQNFSAVSNADYPRLIDQAQRTTGQAGCQLWAKSEQALFGNFDVIPVAAVKGVSYLQKATLRNGVADGQPLLVALVAN